MDAKVLWLVFVTAFIAELGDKSQVLTLLYASSRSAPPLVVFIGVSCALVAATAIGVLAGSVLSAYITPKLLNWFAGSGFILLGVMTLYQAAKG